MPPRFSGIHDDRFEVTGARQWYLIGNDLTAGQGTMDLMVTARGTEDVDTVHVWIAGAHSAVLEKDGDRFVGRVDIHALGPGSYEALLAFGGSDDAFARLEFRRTHPLYVLVSNDWDDPDHGNDVLERQEALHEAHPELKMTHLVGPYTFTEPEVSETRRSELVTWLLGMRDAHDDEIGLHIHPYCSFVDFAGVRCLHAPSLVHVDDDPTGYTIMCSAYSELEFTRLLESADRIFKERGLGKPTSFRAGGWTADLSVLRALASTGYLVDSSANNWRRMEEWKGHKNGVLYEWNAAHWPTIGDTSQPYYPSSEDVLSSKPPNLPVLEVPDNGSLVDYVTGDEMIEIFEANWGRGALDSPRQLSIGYHPVTLDEAYAARMDQVLTHTDQFLASRGDGPVVYETLSNMALVF